MIIVPNMALLHQKSKRSLCHLHAAETEVLQKVWTLGGDVPMTIRQISTCTFTWKSY